jgi:hypothetical protein
MPRKPRRTTPEKIDPNQLKTRDHLLVLLITGTTKAGPHRDERKEANRKACRKKVLATDD